jgi:hypothetical protein
MQTPTQIALSGILNLKFPNATCKVRRITPFEINFGFPCLWQATEERQQ